MSVDVFSLEEISDASVGGKAYGLSRLVSMGLPVPPAFVLRNASGGEQPESLSRFYADIGAGPVAVRSSALGEDGEDASFAGQYETVLNVQGLDALQQAIARCVDSLSSERAHSYQREQADTEAVGMNIVVQVMVDARAAGVVFTADPVSARRDLLVVDAVAGLGEKLVSGEATPDHYRVDSGGHILGRQLAGSEPLLSDAEIEAIAVGARGAALHEGQPLDLEWAIDQDGVLYWLQARPVTTLPADLNAFDTPLPRPDDVLTISNVSEMMPGAVCPLTGSFTGWGIDYGLQHMQVAVGARSQIQPDWQITAWAFGHLFLNLTGNVVMSSAVLGSTVEQTGQALCGRVIPELKALPPQSLPRRIFNTARLLRYCLKAPSVVQRFGDDLATFRVEHKDNSRAMWSEIEGKADFFNHAMAVHIQSSALSGFLSSIVENMVSGRSNNSTSEEQSEAVRLLSGATGVESAVMLEKLDALVDRVAAHADAPERFREATPAEALAWLRNEPELGAVFAQFLQENGHRGYRELCMRDPAWGESAEPLIQSMQAAVNARLLAGELRQPQAGSIEWSQLSRGLRWVLPKAHDAIRRREHTKSQLVAVAHQFKLAFQHLGKLLQAEGVLPEADLVNFFSFDELPGLVAGSASATVDHALARREALHYQQSFEFSEISVGAPQPLEERSLISADGVLHGRPASRGVIEGVARVAHTLAEAAALLPGEILVTPITDIGWTPYFSLIGGLVTDLGSAVSHGAVIAREYGLPCVVNTREGTVYLQTGDRIRLDGDKGVVEKLPA